MNGGRFVARAHLTLELESGKTTIAEQWMQVGFQLVTSALSRTFCLFLHHVQMSSNDNTKTTPPTSITSPKINVSLSSLSILYLLS